MFASLQIERNYIALEADGLVMPNIPALLARVLPEAKAAFSGLISRFAPSEPAIPSLNRQQREFVEVTKKFRYLDLAPIVAYVPEGLNVSYAHYANVLAPIVTHVEGVEKLLNTYVTYLAMLVTNRDHRHSMVDSGWMFKSLEEQRATFNNDLKSCFENGSHVTEVKYGDVIERNSDWPQLFVTVQQLSDKMNSVNRKSLQKATADAVHLMDKVTEMVKRGELKDGSPAMVKEIADGAFQVASELEMFAVTYYRIVALTTSIEDTMKNVLRIHH